jgi:two-component system, NarL family, nitrate/nitrite response regulator NarL
LAPVQDNPQRQNFRQGERSKDALRILIIDDHRLLAESVASFLNEIRGFDVLIALDLASGLKLLREAGPVDLVLLDVVMPGESGITAIEHAIADAAPVPVVVFSGNTTEQTVRTALDRGARGFIPKSFPLRALATAIELVANGEIFVPSGFALHPHATDGSGIAGLNNREVDVLRMVAEGKTNKVIAFGLGISEASVKMVMRSICSKLSADNRAHAALKAKELQII